MSNRSSVCSRVDGLALNNRRMNRLLLSVSLVVFFVFTRMPAHGQSMDYDETADLDILAGLPNTRMHYQRLSSPLRPKAAIWEGLENEIDALLSGTNDYARLEALVHEKSASELQALVAEGALSYEQITRYFIARIYAVETDDARYLNAVISLNPRAIEAAKLADRERNTGKPSHKTRNLACPFYLKTISASKTCRPQQALRRSLKTLPPMPSLHSA